jgi:hypothetical protein
LLGEGSVTNFAGCRLSIHRHIHYPKDQWLFSCNLLGIDNAELKSKDLEEAKQEAIGKAVFAAKRQIEALKGLVGILDDEVNQ